MEQQSLLSSTPFLYGGSVILRPPQISDKDDRQSAGAHAEYRRLVGADNPSDLALPDEAIDAWYQAVCTEPHHWMIETGGHCVGTARLHHLDEHNRRARYAIGIFNVGYWSRGVGTEATKLVLRYAFEVLHLHRVDLARTCVQSPRATLLSKVRLCARRHGA